MDIVDEDVVNVVLEDCGFAGAVLEIWQRCSKEHLNLTRLSESSLL